ncbi:MAG: hypothetical protein J6A01_05650, partial [Proteobacteria bacterium]|nr:hypothetical protein [Pseudomonadota bacterium]
MRIRRIIPLCLLSAALCLSCSKKKEEAPKEAEPVVEADSQPSPDAEAKADDSKDNNDTEGKANADPNDSGTQQDPQTVRSSRKPMWHGYAQIQAKTPGLSQNPIFKTIPNSSFLILASTGEFEYQRKDLDDFFSHISTLVMANLKQLPDTETPFQKSVHTMFRGILRNFSSSKLMSLGLSGETLGHFAFYFVRQTPVLKITLSDVTKFQSIIESYWKQNNIELRTPADLTTSWSLIPIEENSSAALAMHWGLDSLTITLVSDDEHAGKLLPDLSVVPPEEKSAVSELSAISISDSTYIVGVLDMNAMLNQLVQLQEQAKKFSDNSDKTEIDKRCIKDLHRIASIVPRIVLQVTPLSGGMVFGVDAKFSFELQNDAWLKEMMEQAPQVTKFPKYAAMPLANFWMTLPVKQLMSISATYRDAIKLDPFTCPWFTGLNDLENDAIGEMTSIPQFALHTHYVGAVLYEGTVDSPKKYAASYHSEKAAEMASLMHIIQSDKLLKKMGLAEEEPAEVPDPEPEKTDDSVKPDDTAAEAPAAAPAEAPAAAPVEAPAAAPAEAQAEPAEAEQPKQPEGPVIYDDAQIAMDGAPKDAHYQVTDESIIFASEDGFLKEMSSGELKTTDSFIHFEMSERLLENQDADIDRDFHVGVDMGITP